MDYLMLSSISTPIGDFHMIIEPNYKDGVVCVSGFGEPEDVQARLPEDRIDRRLEPADNHPYAKLVRNYFWGNMHAMDAIPHQQEGSQFYTKVWQTLENTQPGNVVSYRELAQSAGDPKAARAAGTACAKNKLVLLVPCHRAVKSDGEIGNYIYGTDMKRFLLQHEANFLPVS